MSNQAKSSGPTLSETLQCLEEGLHVFGLLNGDVQALPSQGASMPLLTSSGEPDEVKQLVDCFANWDGEVKIAALQSEGLLDVWVV
ncbi:hypothetical protein [Pseudomonas mosselii]|uniref:hypothetical protein n=1 Tax=Pseudomonas mosselii TaxID=78327 RepID=UPI0021D86F78|nr:hypothetical protein [Pseudomonas mosselii]MCU9527575.1 hypothetical protein [Pseudomonas mosselii]MCU9534888.1 hypothetical protein [Pseudomonas mosselii]MCU9542391.1 hypothetical protein [Pseudomonas mosselii]MCU9546728.1 hypothetical protein [Pseudomonas mosselii]